MTEHVGRGLAVLAESLIENLSRACGGFLWRFGRAGRACLRGWLIPTISIFALKLIHKWIPMDYILQSKGIVLLKAFVRQHVLLLMPVLRLWFLWYGRNDKKHRNILFTTDRTIWRITAYLLHLAATKLFKAKGKQKQVKMVRWLKPSPGWVKLNTDGACKGNPSPATVAGVVRNCDGQSLLMFSEFLGHMTNGFVELYAIGCVLDLCYSKNFVRVWVETNSMITLQLLPPPQLGQWQLQYLI
ncbi:hypothetical protein CDL12_17665 [Handroanthus impetiginosus]|uniref:RNase H type-1 domain-containing protein n=1 Tax=Handroanthus impetiginosus TaxID=429701 RepID=A0A2G9GWU4_9LAMI|nr:hypothetical protein CDL12_17665 [Handroanthus impetiginosus]